MDTAEATLIGPVISRPVRPVEGAGDVAACVEELERLSADLHDPSRDEILSAAAGVLAACEDLRVLERHRDEWIRLLRASPDIVATTIIRSTRSCGGGCSVARFWSGALASALGDQLARLRAR